MTGMGKSFVVLLAAIGCAHPRVAAPPPEAAQPVNATPRADWRARLPKGGPPAEIKLPKPIEIRLKNGLSALVVEDHTVPLVAVQLIVFAGAAEAPPSKAGLADLVAALLDEGSRKYNALALSDALDNIGAELRTGASHDAAFISLSSLADQLGHALDLFAEVVVRPTFPEAEIDRLRQERLTALTQEKDQPAAMFRNTLQRVLYGDDHPYAYPLLGLEPTLKALNRQDVVAFWKAHYVPNNSKLIVVGDVVAEELKKLLTDRLGTWKPRPVHARKLPPVPEDGKARMVYWVDKPMASQSVVGLGNVGAARTSEDYFPLLVLNHILGGAFSSRINMNLRERKGYSYGARSAFAFLREPGPFFAGGNVRADVTRESLDELLKELQRIRTAPVTTEELVEAKSSLIGKLPARFETQAATAGMLAELVTYGLPLEWYESFAERVRAVAAADVLRVAQKYVRPDHAAVVVVGDAKAEAAVKAAGFGAIEERGPLGEKR